MYHIIICDDDKMFIKYMKNMILSSGVKEGEAVFYEYCSGEDLLEKLDRNISYDLLILDMQMKELGGNETAKLFREDFPGTTLIFCSGVCLPTVESFETTPFRYLLKEYPDSRMLQEMNVIVKHIQEKKAEPFIVGTYYGNMVKLKPDEILYVALAKRGSHIYTLPGVLQYQYEKHIICRDKIDKLYGTLKDFGFVYAHYSYLVNLKYIKSKTTKELELMDGTMLSVSRSKEKELRAALAEYLGKKY